MQIFKETSQSNSVSPEPFGPRAQSPTVKRAKRLWGRECIRPKILAQSRPQSPRYLGEWVRVTALTLNLALSRGFSLKKIGVTGEGKNPGETRLMRLIIPAPPIFLTKSPGDEFVSSLPKREWSMLSSSCFPKPLMLGGL